MVVSTSEKFKYNIIDLMDLSHELICKLTDNGVTTLNPNLINMGEKFIFSYNDDDLIENFITKSNQHWSLIKSRDEEFIVNNASELFKNDSFPNLDMNIFKDIYLASDDDGELIIDEDDRESIWDYMDSLVKLSIKYIHERRTPVLVPIVKDGVEKVVKRYRNPYLQEIKLNKVSRSWGINLEWL